MPPPRPIGIVGGVGPMAGLDLVHKITAATRARRDQDHLPVTLVSHPHRIADRTDFLLGRTTTNPGVALADLAEALVAGGAEVVAIPCNTAHAPAIVGHVRERLDGRAEFVDLIDAVADEIRRRFPAARRVGVLSTTGTQAARVYPDRLAPLGLDVIAPDAALQESTVHPAIYDATYGVKSVSAPVTDQAVAGLRAGLDHLIEAGAEVVVLACTEIPLALPMDEVGGVPVLDATHVLARAVVRRSCPEALADA
jgi:aspartate racemase